MEKNKKKINKEINQSNGNFVSCSAYFPKVIRFVFHFYEQNVRQCNSQSICRSLLIVGIIYTNHTHLPASENQIKQKQSDETHTLTTERGDACVITHHPQQRLPQWLLSLIIYEHMRRCFIFSPRLALQQLTFKCHSSAFVRASKVCRSLWHSCKVRIAAVVKCIAPFFYLINLIKWRH